MSYSHIWTRLAFICFNYTALTRTQREAADALFPL